MSAHDEVAKDLRALAVAQGIHLNEPVTDYVAIARAIWPTEEDAEKFRLQLQAAQRANRELRTAVDQIFPPEEREHGTDVCRGI